METKTKKLLLSVLFLVVVFVGLISVLVLVKQRQVIQKKAAGGNATIDLQPNPISAIVGGQFTVEVHVNSVTVPVNGVDVITSFDPTRMHLVSIENTAALPTPATQTNFRTFAPVKTDGTFDAQRVIDCANTGISGGSTANCPSGAGKVEFGAVAFIWRASDPPTPTPSPTNIPAQALAGGVFARLVFMADGAGSSPISTVVTGLGTTTDSNVVEASTSSDILNGALSTTIINITLATTPTPTTGVPTVTPTLTPTPTQTQSQKRDVSNDGYVNPTDISAVIAPPFPCEIPGYPDVGYTTCLTGVNLRRDTNSDGYINPTDISRVILAPFPCELPSSPDVGYTVCP